MTFKEEIFQAAKARRKDDTQFHQTLLDRFMDSNKLFDQEDYLYTPVENWFKKQTSSSESNAKNWQPEFESDNDFSRLKMVNGELTLDPLIEGISVRKKEMLQAEEMQTTPSMISNLLTENVFQVTIEAHVKLKRAILLERSLESASINGTTIEFKLKTGSQVELIEIIPGQANGSSFLTTHIDLEKHAQLDHLQISKNGNFLLHETKTNLQQQATYRNITITVGGNLVRKNLVLNLLETGSSAESYSLSLARGDEHVDLASVIQHFSADTQSKQVAKAIIDDEAKSIFSGKIHIAQNAQRVSASQLNKNLILSEKGTAHSRPQLEIFADDVKCSHGSTTGQLSDEEIFYFSSRGIPEKKARNILSLGFGKEIIMKVNNPFARKLIINELLQELEAKFQ
jgi:Fe-S cluster assembly protein SufD